VFNVPQQLNNGRFISVIINKVETIRGAGEQGWSLTCAPVNGGPDLSIKLDLNEYIN